MKSKTHKASQYAILSIPSSFSLVCPDIPHSTLFSWNLCLVSVWSRFTHTRAVRVKSKVVPVLAMKMYEVWKYSPNLLIDGGEFLDSRSGYFTPWQSSPSTNWIGGCLDILDSRKNSFIRRESSLVCSVPLKRRSNITASSVLLSAL